VTPGPAVAPAEPAVPSAPGPGDAPFGQGKGTRTQRLAPAWDVQRGPPMEGTRSCAADAELGVPPCSGVRPEILGRLAQQKNWILAAACTVLLPWSFGMPSVGGEAEEILSGGMKTDAVWKKVGKI